MDEDIPNNERRLALDTLIIYSVEMIQTGTYLDGARRTGLRDRVPDCDVE